MSILDSVIVIAVWLFVATHIDTVLVMAAFCADPEYRTFEVTIGHFLGFTVGLVGALIGGIIAAELLTEWTFLLGLIPLGLGISRLRQQYTTTEQSVSQVGTSGLNRIVIVTSAGIGLSGENIAVLIPFFAERTITELGVITALYLLGAVIVLVVALGVGKWITTVALPKWIDRWAVPGVLIIVGTYVTVSGWMF